MTVRVYRNLHRGRPGKPVYSVMVRGRVVAHVRRIALTGVRFVVRAAGRERCLREHKKNVHAFVMGVPGPWESIRGLCQAGVRYNPYQAGSFVLAASQREILEAPCAVIDEHGVHVMST